LLFLSLILSCYISIFRIKRKLYQIFGRIFQVCFDEDDIDESALDVQSFRTADYDADHSPVVANVRERLTVNKPRSHRIHMERFKLKKLNTVEGKEKYCVEVLNRLAGLED
jgi:hypothetical protein